MKKIFIILLFLFVFLNYAHATCYCEAALKQAFKDISKKVEDDIGAQKTSVEKLIDEIKKNTDDIKAQNEVIAKIIKAETRKAVQNTQIVFLLQKIAELKTAGEM
jgi:septal ring factor EnvC (AmiA/AmiB activator)